MRCDAVIAGAGIVGAATARELQRRRPDWRVLLLDKETEAARHQTGRNSGVIHAGVYYAPGSLKARFCRAGHAATLRFCREQGLSFEQCGKLLVAVSEAELPRLDALLDRARANGVDCRRLAAAELRELEPHIAGLAAGHVPATAITDFAAVCRRLVQVFVREGGEFHPGTPLQRIEENDGEVTLYTGSGAIRSRRLVCCAGLQADRLVRRHGLHPDFRIVPFRGEYYRLPARRSGLVRHLIYPVPDPDLPFLGVHLTRMIDGGITVGPNAVPGFKREGYGRVNLSLRDSLETMSYPGFWKLAARYPGAALREWKNSLCRPGYLALLRRYCPELEPADLLPHPAGVRAQAVLADGTLVQDFLFRETPRVLHVCNAPSPAATSAMPIAEYICDRMLDKVT